MIKLIALFGIHVIVLYCTRKVLRVIVGNKRRERAAALQRARSSTRFVWARANNALLSGVMARGGGRHPREAFSGNVICDVHVHLLYPCCTRWLYMKAYVYPQKKLSQLIAPAQESFSRCQARCHAHARAYQRDDQRGGSEERHTRTRVLQRQVCTIGA